MAKRKFTLSAPNQVLWIVALVVGFLGILGHYVDMDALSKYSYEMLLIGFGLLIIGTAYRGI
jgi:hypothetical protein